MCVQIDLHSKLIVVHQNHIDIMRGLYQMNHCPIGLHVLQSGGLVCMSEGAYFSKVVSCQYGTVQISFVPNKSALQQRYLSNWVRFSKVDAFQCRVYSEVIYSRLLYKSEQCIIESHRIFPDVFHQLPLPKHSLS